LVKFTDENPDGSFLGPTSALKAERRYHTVVSRLRDASLTSFLYRSKGRQSFFKRGIKNHNELKELGMTNQLLYINGVFKAIDNQDLLANKIER
jgi:arsenite-transporting ATPase